MWGTIKRSILLIGLIASIVLIAGCTSQTQNKSSSNILSYLAETKINGAYPSITVLDENKNYNWTFRRFLWEEKNNESQTIGAVSVFVVDSQTTGSADFVINKANYFNFGNLHDKFLYKGDDIRRFINSFDGSISYVWIHNDKDGYVVTKSNTNYDTSSLYEGIIDFYNP